MTHACVYVNKETGMRLALVVDGILCRGPMGATVQFYKDLEKRFEVKDPTYLTDETPIKYVTLLGLIFVHGIRMTGYTYLLTRGWT